MGPYGLPIWPLKQRIGHCNPTMHWFVIQQPIYCFAVLLFFVQTFQSKWLVQRTTTPHIISMSKFDVSIIQECCEN